MIKKDVSEDQAAIELLQELIRFPSTFENEHGILAYVESLVRSLGQEPIRVYFRDAELQKLPEALPPFSAMDNRFNIVVRLPGCPKGRSLVINSHLDVVPEGRKEDWDHPPFQGYYDNEQKIVYGRGAMDDKAGVAIALTLMKRLLSLPVNERPQVTFHFVLEDETTGNGSLLCLQEGYCGDGAVIVDGTRGDKAINQHAGSIQFDIEVAGKPAPLCVSHTGVNAAEFLAELVTQLKQKIYSLNQRIPPEWQIYPSPNQFVVERFSSDNQTLTLPVHAIAGCYVSYTPNFEESEIKRFIEEYCAERERADQDVRIHVKWNGNRIPPSKNVNNDFECCFANALIANNYSPPDFVPSTGTSDMRHFSQVGVPCVLFGPGKGYNPHRANEHFYTETLLETVDKLQLLAAAWCKG